VRLVTWNCNGALRRKHQLLDALDADILVIQECEDPAQSTDDYKAWAGDHAWVGYSKNKGIGIFPRRGQSIEQLDWSQEQGGLFLPVCVDGSITVLGVWTLSRKATGQFSYIAQFWHYLQLNRPRLEHGTLICGDFNSNQIWDATRKRRNHSDCVRELGEAGFRSLYHLAKGEGQGVETEPTFYLHRSDLKPYHIDYVFAHDAMLRAARPTLKVGSRPDWIGVSDHMPVVVDFPDIPLSVVRPFGATRGLD
jgi:exonuclease III